MVPVYAITRADHGGPDIGHAYGRNSHLECVRWQGCMDPYQTVRLHGVEVSQKRLHYVSDVCKP